MNINPQSWVAALERLASIRGRNWLVLCGLLAWAAWMTHENPQEALQLALAISQAPGAPVYAMGLIVIGLLMVIYRGVQEELIESRNQHELCRAEQSAMRTAITTMALELPEVSRDKAESIIRMLDSAIVEARERFRPRDKARKPVAGGGRADDPEVEP